MQNVFRLGLLIAGILVFSSFSTDDTEKEKIKWYTWEEAIEASKTDQKKIFIDVYTDWCGWCKRMDKSTFQDKEVIKYLNENFYPVKFNAEQREDIVYKDHILKYIANGRRGYHELAYSLLDGRMGYPAFVYLDETQNRITISPGYKDASTIMKELKFIGGGHYKTTPFETFVKEYENQ